MLHGIYQIKDLVRKKSLLFWSLLFPLFLGTIFYFMFGSIQEMEMFTEIPVGVVLSDDEQDSNESPQQSENPGVMSVSEKQNEFVEIAGSVEMDNGKKMFSITTFDSKDAAMEALKNEEITGVIDLNNQYEVTVLKSATDTTLIKTFIDQYMQNEKLFTDIAMNHPEMLSTLLGNMNDTNGRKISISNIELKGQDKDCYSQYFFALLAMTCLIASDMGCAVGCNLQANCSTLGARRGVAPTTKIRQLVTDFLATFVLYDVLSLIVLFFCMFVLKRDFGTNLPLIMAATFVGNFNGLAAGMFISTWGKGDANKKSGFCVLYFMASSFLAGLQWADITFVLEKHCPIINRINPATLIVNSYKSLAVFGDYQKYMTNLVTLFGIGVLFILLSVWKLRRIRYASL